MKTTTENVTPAKAEAWLNANKSNRKMREGVAEKYAADMKHGRWTQCPVPISFYDDGDVADGQHRLWAIIDSGVTLTFNITRGLTRADGLNIDTGLGRTIIDNARISKTATDLTNELLSTCRAIEDGAHVNGRATRSNAERVQLVDKHRESAQWACSNGPRGRLLRNAITLGAVGRAYLTEPDTNRLKRFCDVLSTGYYDGDGETAAVTLRNYLLQKGAATSSSALWRDTWLKTQNAIQAFMRGRKLTVIKGVSEEPYPLRKTSKLRRAA